jgi:hypothetical protein
MRGGARAAALVVLGLSGCPSPVNDDAIERLGGECPDVAPSEFHRPAQPCVLCHGDYQGDSPLLALGGTVYATRQSTNKPVAGARVEITDANGETRAASTNCVGNFQIAADDWQPAFPLHVELFCPDGDDMTTTDWSRKALTHRVVMGSRVARDGSCGGCHVHPTSIASPGLVYCYTTDPGYPSITPQGCPQGYCAAFHGGP